MSRGGRRLAAGALLAILAGLQAAGAQQATLAPLGIEEVLASSARNYPGILQSLAARRAASSRRLEAEGSFDLVFSSEGFSRVGGFYDGSALQATAKQPLRTLGASIYSGYKLSEGDFPVYEDENFTNSGGALKVGVLFSLLRDRSIDDRRFRETDARLNLREAELDLLLTKIGVQERAMNAYWRWVTIGRQLRVYEYLWSIAVERQGGLEEQVRRGARAQIFLTENLQNITRRQTLVTTAERDLAMAANALSMYYRDDDGRPLIIGAGRLPPGVEINAIYNLASPEALPVPEALERRPELELLRTAIQREQNRIALAENQLKPRLDLNLEVQESLGGIAEGGPSRDSTDTVIGFTFTVPLQRRSERGKLLRSQAELEAKQQARRLREQQIEIELRNLMLDLTVSRELLLLAAQQVQQSEIMRTSELRRFQSGASDFFLLNLREETAADARVRLLQAELSTRLARAAYDAATVDLVRLGIEPEFDLP